MLSTERGAFAKLIEVLCAGYNVPATEARLDAYWRGCNRMHLAAFERTVDFILGPDGDAEDLPTPRQIHIQHRRMLAAQRSASEPTHKLDGPELDKFDRYAGQVLFSVLCSLTSQHGSGASDASLAEMVHVKHRFAAGYREMCIAEPDACEEMRDAMKAALTRQFVPREPSKQQAAPT